MSEDMLRAAHMMQRAADDMKQVALNLDGSIRDMRQALDNWTRELTNVLEHDRKERAVPIAPSPAPATRQEAIDYICNSTTGAPWQPPQDDVWVTYDGDISTRPVRTRAVWLEYADGGIDMKLGRSIDWGAFATRMVTRWQYATAG